MIKINNNTIQQIFKSSESNYLKEILKEYPDMTITDEKNFSTMSTTRVITIGEVMIEADLMN